MMETTQTAHVLTLEKQLPVSARQSPESRAEYETQFRDKLRVKTSDKALLIKRKPFEIVILGGKILKAAFHCCPG